MSYDSIENKYEIISKIGEGGYGVIYKAREIGTTNIVSLKQIKKQLSRSNEGIPQSILCEIDILKDLKGNSNIIKLRDIIINKFSRNVYIVYDFNEFDVNTLIHQKKSLTYQQVKFYSKQMINALQAVHSKGYIHGDIKPSNFLVSSNNEINLIDFGVSLKIDDDEKTSIIGTLNYNAPELILGENNYGEEIDIWSLGCTIYEMITKEKYIRSSYSEKEIANQMIQIYGLPNKKNYPQFFSFPNKDLFFKYLRCSNLSLDEYLDKNIPDEFKTFKKLLIGMLQFNPKDRIKLNEALKDPVLRDYEPKENLPVIVLEEPNYFKCKKNSYKNKKNSRLFANLRPARAVPPNFV